MASTKAPLFGLDASGTIGKSIVFSKWKGRTYVRRHAIPSNPQSPAQVGVRAIMTFLTQFYASLTAPQVAEWDALAASDQITPLNAMVRDGMNRAKIGQGWRRNPSAAVLTTINAPTAGAAAALPQGLRVSWTRPVANQGNFSVVVYMSTTTGFTPGRNTIQIVLPVATVTTDILGLETGVPYYFRNCEESVAGELGTLQAQWTGTPT
jgi:hypothetical protein